MFKVGDVVQLKYTIGRRGDLESGDVGVVTEAGKYPSFNGVGVQFLRSGRWTRLAPGVLEKADV